MIQGTFRQFYTYHNDQVLDILLVYSSKALQD